jgi:hypothetical protein
MRDNVSIVVRERGKIIARREGHNVFVTRGHQWLMELTVNSSFSPVTPVRNDRLRYMQLGIGSIEQVDFVSCNNPPLSTSYPAGSDPNATTGYEYRKDYPVYPPISTLERPVRISGGSTAYPGAITDNWLVESPNLYTTHPSAYSLAVHGVVNGTAGDIVYAPFLSMPLSEVALLTDEVGVGLHTAYSPIVAYFSFVTIPMSPTTDIEVIWTLRF